MRTFKDQTDNSRASVFLALIAAVTALGIQVPARADSVYDVSTNTTSLLGTGSMLAFDFIAGGGTQTNSISISGFSSDGTLIPASTSGAVNSGSVSGALPSNVTLTNATFFNEYQQGMTLGSAISFQLDLTRNAPTGSSLPDTFSFFILDPTASYSLVNTTDPTGANSLFALQIDGTPGGILGVYSSSPSVPVTVTAVPLPGALGLLLSGLAGIGFFGMRKRSAPERRSI
jgi:hypothetical protein